MTRTLLSLIAALAIAPAAAAGPAANATTSTSKFGDGTYRVGKDIAPGTYRARGGNGCYWERLASFSGTLKAILANDNASGPTVVTILRTDKGFMSSRCGTWTARLTRITKSTSRFGPGTYIVGLDIAPGTYRSSGTSGCYWERLKGFTGTLNAIIANDNARGQAIVTIARSDKGFSSSRCGTWTRLQ
jgi:hypothetical protein